MYTVLILWAPDTAENRRVVDAVAAACGATKFVTLVKKAAEATIADISAADIVVFGTQKSGAAEVPSEFSEFQRAFKGVTFAGRTAAFFSMGSEKATSRLRKALRDAEIPQLDEDPLFPDQKQGTTAEISEWVRKLAGFHQEIHHART